MGWPVVLTPQSQDDLREIVSFIARDSPSHARRFGNLLVDAAISLREQPERGRVMPELGDPAVREIVRGAYRIFYEVLREPDAVYVLRFWHGARGTPEVAKV